MTGGAHDRPARPMAEARNPRVATAVLLAAAVLLAGCKAPRSPREAAEGKVTGQWTAESTAVGPPVDTGRARWVLELEQRQAGKVRGRGSVSRGGAAQAFSLSGVRGESEIQFEFELAGERVRYHGGIADAETMVGEMYLPGDTLPVTFTRKLP